jgi:ferritin
MELYSYTPFLLLGLFTIVSMLCIFAWSERERKKEDRKMFSFLRQMHIENLQEKKENRKILQELKQISKGNQMILKGNQIILQRIF